MNTIEEINAKIEELNAKRSDLNAQIAQIDSQISELNNEIPALKKKPYDEFCNNVVGKYYKYVLNATNHETVYIYASSLSDVDESTRYINCIAVLIVKNDNDEIVTSTIDKNGCYAISFDFADENGGYLQYSKFEEIDETAFNESVNQAKTINI